MAFSEDGRRLAVAADRPVVSVWDADTGRVVVEPRTHMARVMAVAFHPRGDRLLTASADGTVHQWDPRPAARSSRPTSATRGRSWRRRTARTGSGSPRPARTAPSGCGGRRAAGRRGPARPHGDRAPSWPSPRTAGGWSPARTTAGRRASGRWARSGHACRCCAATRATSTRWRTAPTAGWIASGSWDHTVRLWDAATGEASPTLPHGGIVRALALSPDGTWLVARATAAAVASGTSPRAATVATYKAPPETSSGRSPAAPTAPTSPCWAAGTRHRGPRATTGGRVATADAGERLEFSPPAGPWPTAPTAAGWPCYEENKVVLLGRANVPAGRHLPRPRGEQSCRSPSAPTAAGSPRAGQDRTVRSVDDRQRRLPGAARAHRRGLRGGLPPRRHAPGLGRPRPAGLAVGPGDGRGGGPAAGAHELRLVAGLQPRRRDAGVRLRRHHGPPVGHRAAEGATRRAARPRPCGPRPNDWSEMAGRRRTTRPEVVDALRADRA